METDGLIQNPLNNVTIYDDRIEMTKHSSSQLKKHFVHLALLIILLSSLYPFLQKSSYAGSSDIHVTMETIGALLGIATGFFLIARFLSIGNRFHLFIGLAFFVSGAEDFLHGLLLLVDIGWIGGSATELAGFILGTFVTGRLLLGIILMIAPAAPRWMEKKKLSLKHEVLWVSLSVILFSVIVTVLTVKLPLPQMIIPEDIISRPVEFLTAMILVLALSSFIREYIRGRDMFTWWIIISITVNIISQMFMSFSKEFYDAFFSIADVYKVVGYLVPLIGFSLYQIGSINERRWSEEILQKGKEDLEAKVKERTNELEEVNTRLLDELSERKRAEEKVASIVAELSQLIKTANAPILGIDIEGNINEWNQATERMTNFSREEVIGKDLIEEFISEEYRVKVKEVWDNALKGEDTDSYEFSLSNKDGSGVMVLMNATTRRDYHGNIIGVMGVGQDITELTRSHDELEKQVEERTSELNKSLFDTSQVRDRLDGILKSVADGLIVTDIYSRVILMNRAAEDLLGVRFSEVIDRPIDFAIKEETLREKVKDIIDKKVTGYQYDFDMPGEDPEHPHFMRARTSVLIDREGKITGVVTIIHEVTIEREIDRMKTEFLSTAAHELRTPLTSIQGFSEILLTRDDVKDDEKKKFLTYINSQSVNLAKIVNDLLDISRIESRQGFTFNKAMCDINLAITDVIPVFQDISKKHKIEVVLPNEPVELFIDKEKIEQVLKNLVSNSVKYSPDGGVITLTGKVNENSFELIVEDEGIGMTPEQVEKIFEKFYRANASDTAPEGTGLGMTIVKYIVEMHEGNIQIESEFGKGTTVRFAIPIHS